jgi:hypothetical protein
VYDLTRSASNAEVSDEERPDTKGGTKQAEPERMVRDRKTGR